MALLIASFRPEVVIYDDWARVVLVAVALLPLK